MLSGQLKPAGALVIADELQILGDPTRGPDIEALCAVLRQRGVRQFLALTATVQNPEDLAGWMQCTLVRSAKRDVPLHQEIWYQGRVHRTTFGQQEGSELETNGAVPSDIMNVVGQLLRTGRGPVLVFTESRREAATYAASFGQHRPRASEGIALAKQLDLFSEPTESSEQLRDNAEKRVAFHSADLSPQERQIVESGFADSKFEVCFATSTLAAGVNFPFRSIVFPKLTFSWGDRAGTQLPRTDYRNMSGRAGRLGMHSEGFSVLLPTNRVELAHANKLVQPDNDHLDSQFVNLSLRKSILLLSASRLASTSEEVMAFFQHTLYWYQILERNPAKLKRLEAESKTAIQWLIGNSLLLGTQDSFLITPLGAGVALSGLLPSTAVQLAAMLQRLRSPLEESFDEWIPGLVYAVCASDEFRGERPSRCLPFPARYTFDSITYWSTQKLPVTLDRSDTKLAQCTHAIVLFLEGVSERKITYATNLSSGYIHRLALDVSWVLDGLHKLSAVPDVGCPQTVSNQISMLSRRVRWGAPAEALDVIRVAERHGVPGFGRQRAMALIAQGITTLHDILATAKNRLIQVLRDERRAQALLDAASSTVGITPNRLVRSHERVAKELGLEQLVAACNKEVGVDYEKAVVALLQQEASWVVTVLDEGGRQNVPDLLIELGDRKVILECKTCVRSPALIRKEEAWAVLQKAADFEPRMWRTTLGKPTFDESSKRKAAASHDITLVEHSAFVEGLLRVHAGTLSPDEFLKWLMAPGLAEIERLGGTPTFITSPERTSGARAGGR